jgi:LacI family xylobiose transport system transcriptional regulator
MLGTEIDLGRQSGLSRVSVRRAIDRLMSKGLVERRAGKGIFVRSPEAAVRTIQIVVPNLQFDQCVQIARGAQEFGRSRGAQVQIYDAHGSMAQDIEVIRRLPDSRSDGAIIVFLQHPDFAQALYSLKAVDYPFVMVDSKLQDLAVPSVTSDNYAGGYAVGQNLVALGHTAIGCIGWLSARTVQARFDGLRDAVIDAKLPFDRSMVLDLGVEDPIGDWAAAIEGAVRTLLTRPDRPTAIFFGSDEVAIQSYRVIRQLGLSIPGDLSIVGFDDSSLCQLVDPPLATVRQSSSQMGQVAMEILLSHISGDRTVVSRTLPTAWVPRGSIAAPRPAGAMGRAQGADGQDNANTVQ